MSSEGRLLGRLVVRKGRTGRLERGKVPRVIEIVIPCDLPQQRLAGIFELASTVVAGMDGKLLRGSWDLTFDG